MCSRERGFALLLATVIAVLLTLIGLTLTTNSITEYQGSTEFEAHQKALLIADAGLSLVKEDLRGQILSDLLSTPTQVPKYLSYDNPEAGSLAARNPIPPFEARNINFDDPPATQDSRTVYALLTDPSGDTITDTSQGRYFASLTDNSDEALYGLVDDPLLDVDFSVFVRVVGIYPVGGGQGSAIGSARKNAVAVLEAELRRDMSFDLSSPLTLQGPDVNANFSGNSFDVTGDEDHPAIGVMNDDPDSNDASTAYESVLDAVGRFGHLSGMEGPDGLPIMDMTETVRSDPDPGSQEILDPDYLIRFANLLAAFADVRYETDQVLSGGNIIMGTAEDPQITVFLGDLDLSGGGSGNGILVVKGDFYYSGAFDFDGVILVLGEGNLYMSGANKDITGGLFVSRVESDGSGGWSLGTPTISIEGNSNFYFDGDSIRLAVSLMPMKVISLREITPEMEP